MSESTTRHESAVGARQRTERSMGSRWNDTVFKAIDGAVLEQVVTEERIYLNRLKELEAAHRRAHSRLDAIKDSTY